MRGGLHLPAPLNYSTPAPLTDASVPPMLTLTMRADDRGETLVTSGAPVLLGQLLACSRDRRLHASVSGIATDVLNANGMLAITIANDGCDTHHPSVLPITNHNDLPPEQLRYRIELAGIVGLGGAGFPTATKLNIAASHNTRLLLINGAECEPFITCDDALMRACADDVVFGTQVLLHASGATSAIIAIESDKSEAASAIARALDRIRDPRLRLQIVVSYYPAGGERQLIESVTACEVPSGGVPADIGVLCHNVGTVAAVAKLVTTGEPLISRVVTMTGNGVHERRTLRARFGTPLASLVADCGGYSGEVQRLIVGGSMMGVAQSTDQIAVSAATNCVVAATVQDIASDRYEMPCIRCGDCAEACPAGLLPQQLLRYARLNDRAALGELGLHDCIECGCCDYVCPSRIPLTSTFDNAKRIL